MTIDELIERRAEESLAEIRQMADEFLMSLGFTRAWINRSRGQRVRRDRERSQR